MVDCPQLKKNILLKVALLLVFSLPQLLWARHVLGGNPVFTAEQLTILENIGYRVGYSENLKNPLWVAYRLGNCHREEKYQRTPRFSTDERTKAKVHPEDYTHSGYSRGHMAPSLAIFLCYGKQAQDETYLMSNIVPQLQKHNAGIWSRVEHLNSREHAREFGEIFIITGPIFNKEYPQVTEKGIPIPAAFYKIVVRAKEKGYEALALVVPHEDAKTANLPSYVNTVRYIEELTGINFFSELPDDIEDELETRLPESDWKLTPRQKKSQHR